jgi:Raf kinase inhibitor-like YbhB/YbcL family protein
MMGFALVSESFKDNRQIPIRYTCDGWDMSPPLLWLHIPIGTQSLALIVDDPDAPDPEAPETPWTHWLLYNIPANVHSLPEGVTKKNLPPGCKQGKNDWGRTEYGGPCPPRGMHRYCYRLFALYDVLPDLRNPGKAALESAMQGRIIARAVLTGLYQRPRA